MKEEIIDIKEQVIELLENKRYSIVPDRHSCYGFRLDWQV